MPRKAIILFAIVGPGFLFTTWNIARADEGCAYALTRYEQAASTETAMRRREAIKTCDSPQHRNISSLQNDLRACRENTSRGNPEGAENCQIETYIVNQRVEYPGPLFEDRAVCLAAYAPFVDERKHLSLTIDGSKIELDWDWPRVIATGLDFDKPHDIKVLYDSKPVESWTVSFRKRQTTMVDIWRSPGSWHLESNPTGKCQRHEE